MNSIIITGASGFVGANVARRFAGDGFEVHVVLRRSSGSWRIDDLAGCVQHRIDLMDDEELEALFRTVAPRFVLHLGAYGAYESQSAVAQMIETNLHVGIRLMEAARAAGVERFVSAGSSSEYGYCDRPARETDRLEPNSLYAITKAALTHYGRLLAQRWGFHVTTLRLYSVYGPYEEPTRLIPRLIVAGMQGGYPPLVAPATARDFVHVDDVVEAFQRALHAPTEPGMVFNVGSGTQMTLGEVVEIVRETFHIERRPEWGSMGRRQWDTNIWVANTESAARDLGWKSRIPFDEGFRRTVRWLTEQPERVSLYRRLCEIR